MAKVTTISKLSKKINQKIISVQLKIEKAKDLYNKYHNEEVRKFSNIGFGYSMRAYHRLKNLSSAKSENQAKRLEAFKAEESSLKLVQNYLSKFELIMKEIFSPEELINFSQILKTKVTQNLDEIKALQAKYYQETPELYFSLFEEMNEKKTNLNNEIHALDYLIKISGLVGIKAK